MKLSQFLNQDYLDDAKNHHQIIYIKNNDTELIKIIDLPRLWMKNQNLYYIKQYNVFGSVETLSRFYGLKEEINNAVSGYNYENNDIFYNEIKSFDEWMIQTLIDNQNTMGKTIHDMFIVTHKPIQNETNKTILDKLSQLPFGKYMDVSDLNKIKYLNMNRKKFVATNIRLMSTNYDNFNYVIHMIPNGTHKYAEDLQKAKIYFNIKTDEPSQIITPQTTSTVDVGVPTNISKKYTKTTPEKSFLQKLSTLKLYKMLDVSNIDKDGHNTVIVDIKNVPKTFYGATDLNIVSDNYDAFLRAIELIPNGPNKYAGDLVLAQAHFGIVESDDEI